MLSDVELFVITWILATVFMIFYVLMYYASSMVIVYKIKEYVTDDDLRKMRWSEKVALRIKLGSTILFILIAILGTVIGYANYLPITERNPETDVFRMFSIQPSFFIALLAIGGIQMYIMQRALGEKLLPEKTVVDT
ncbi:MAG: hypothetical protein OEV85_14030 [Candidatus Thorarchaeota archaeon]|nr:hypothetical protein [Candidatus Thorarchaeota archaeon]